jgi:hypothetical protein
LARAEAAAALIVAVGLGGAEAAARAVAVAATMAFASDCRWPTITKSTDKTMRTPQTITGTIPESRLVFTAME